MGLTPERWEEILRLHAAAEALPQAEREGFLTRECSDPELLAEVRRMLASPPSRGFLEPPQEPVAEPGPTAGMRLGDFTLLREIGRGGMGVVWLARQESLGRSVAVKLLRPGYLLTPRARDRFLREPRALANLAHPNLVTILDAGEAHGERYFAMEFVDGGDLASELTRLKEDREAENDRRTHLPSSRASEYFRTVAECVRQAADALDYVHDNGLVHRDVKPSNLLLDRSGIVKLVDFGVARDEERGRHSKTGEGIPGTLEYMSPEQARQTRDQVDERTDIYSLGVVLYELLTLRLPHSGDTDFQLLQHIIRDYPPRIRKLNPRVPRDLETICSKAMEKDRERRFQTAGELRDELQRFLNHEAIHTRAPGVLGEVERFARTYRSVLTIAAVASGASLAGIGSARAYESREDRLASLARLREARAAGPLDQQPLSRQIELRHELAQMAASGLVGATNDDGDLSALEREFDTLRVAGRERALVALHASKDASRQRSERLGLRIEALLELVRLAQLFPEDETLQALSAPTTAFPTLSVEAIGGDGRGLSAEVWLREIRLDSSVGPKRRLGPTPLAPVPVRPGYYSVVVSLAAGAFRELPLFVDLVGGELALRASFSAESAEGIPDDMVLFEACDYVLPDTYLLGLRGGSVHVDAFALDKTEVSNRQYFEFVQETGHRPPRLWNELSDLEEFMASRGDTPVVDVAVEDAEAFAAWAGKRLPTAPEWMRAACGLEKRPRPYGTDGANGPRGNVLGPPLRRGTESWQDFLEFAAGVRSHEESRTPEGLYHMWGNVEELTASMPVSPRGEELEPLVDARIVLGGAWGSVREEIEPLTPSLMRADAQSRTWHVGFRCAKSVSP